MTSLPDSVYVEQDQLIFGDCIEKMKDLPDNSIDAIVTDPPYGIEFMGKNWDSPKYWTTRDPKKDSVGEGYKVNAFIGARLEKYEAGLPYLEWTICWATEALRVLKPGGSLLCFGGTRTWHWQGVGLELAGFKIKDTISWMYGSGFPKAQDLGKILDKRAGAEREVVGENPNHRVSGDGTWNKEEHQPHTGDGSDTLPATDLARKWDGYKIGGIKPAWEPILWAVKPPEGSWTDNVLKYGVGAVNVEECRVGYQSEADQHGADCSSTWHGGAVAFERSLAGHDEAEFKHANPKGRFPANLLLTHHPDCECVGVKRVKGSNIPGVPSRSKETGKQSWGLASNPPSSLNYTDPDGLETVENWECHPDCPVRLLDEQSGSKCGGSWVGPGSGDKDSYEHGTGRQYEVKGRFPANLILSHHADCVKVGTKRVKGSHGGNYKEPHDVDNQSWGLNRREHVDYNDPDGLETVEAWECHPECPVRLLDEQSGVLNRVGMASYERKWQGEATCYDIGRAGNRQEYADTGGASRFFYSSKATDRDDYNDHPTLKPTPVIKWLVRLVTGPGQLILDPFAGSGTTGVACIESNRHYILIEQDEHYCDIARRRTSEGAQGGLF